MLIALILARRWRALALAGTVALIALAGDIAARSFRETRSAPIASHAADPPTTASVRPR